MLQNFKQKRGQSTMEYAILIIVVIAGLLSVQNYWKRAYQGGLVDKANQISSKQYSDGNTNSIETVKRYSDTIETFNAGTSSSVLAKDNPETTNTTSNSIILNTASEYYGPGSKS